MKKTAALLLTALLLALCACGAYAEGSLIPFADLTWGMSQEQFTQWAQKRGIAVDNWYNSYSLVFPQLANVLGMRVNSVEFSFGENGLESVNAEGRYRLYRQTLYGETVLLDDGELSRALDEMIRRYGEPVEVTVEANNYFRVPPEEYPYIFKDMLRLAERWETSVYLEVHYDNVRFFATCYCPQGDFSTGDMDFAIRYYDHKAIDEWRYGDTPVEKLPVFPILQGKWQYLELLPEEK